MISTSSSAGPSEPRRGLPLWVVIVALVLLTGGVLECSRVSSSPSAMMQHFLPASGYANDWPGSCIACECGDVAFFVGPYRRHSDFIYHCQKCGQTWIAARDGETGKTQRRPQ